MIFATSIETMSQISMMKMRQMSMRMMMILIGMIRMMKILMMLMSRTRTPEGVLLLMERAHQSGESNQGYHQNHHPLYHHPIHHSDFYKHTLSQDVCVFNAIIKYRKT